MKIKKYFLISILFVFSNIFLFSQTATFGIAYDNFASPTLGIFGNISSDLAKNTELEARLKYLNENNYEVLITTNFKPLNFFNLITGFDVILEDNILYPGFVFQTNFITKKSSQYRLGVAVGLNPENVLKPNSFTLKTGLFIKKENAEDVGKKIEKTLSKLEKEVLEMYLDGKSYQEIAKVMGRPPKSIDNALQRIKKKLEKNSE